MEKLSEDMKQLIRGYVEELLREARPLREVFTLREPVRATLSKASNASSQFVDLAPGQYAIKDISKNADGVEVTTLVDSGSAEIAVVTATHVDSTPVGKALFGK